MRLLCVFITLVVCSHAANRFWVGGGPTSQFNATANTNWSTTSGGANNASVPGSTDVAVFDANSPDCTIGNFPTIQSATFIGYTHALTISNTFGPTFNTAFNLTFPATMTLNVGGTSATITLTHATGTTTITTNGISMPALTINAVGSVVLADDYTSVNALTLTKGSFDAQNHNVTIRSFAGSNSNTRALTMGSGNWTLTTANTIWNLATTTGLTFTAPTGTIFVTDVTATAKTFTGGGLTYNNLTITGGASSGTFIFTEGDTWGTISVITGAKTLQFPSSTTSTIAGLSVPGTTGNTVSITASTAGTAATLSKASGSVSINFVSIKDSTATGGATWTAGPVATNVSGNTGWTFVTAVRHRVIQ